MNSELKKYAALAMAAALTVSLAACSGGTQSQPESESLPETSASEPASESSETSSMSESESKTMDSEALTAALDGIKNFESGTAGSSLKAVIAATGIMDWAEKNDFTADDIKNAVTSYVSAMSDEEKTMMAENAKEITSTITTLLTSDEAKALLEAAGNPQSSDSYTPEKAQAASDGIISALKELVPASFTAEETSSAAPESSTSTQG